MKIQNRNELADFIDILDEFELINDNEYSSDELMGAVTNLMGIAKGDLSKKKFFEQSWSREPRILDTFSMMTKQPKKITEDCIHDFSLLEDCTYSRYASLQYVKEFLET